jgi:hypothetical protein
MKYDIFTGKEIKDGEKPEHITKMCLNCKYHVESEEDGAEVHRCNNKNVMDMGIKKIYSSLPEGFEIDTLVVKPMFLKNPTKKCGYYETDFDVILGAIKLEMQ